GPRSWYCCGREVAWAPRELDSRTRELDSGPRELDLGPRELDSRTRELDLRPRWAIFKIRSGDKRESSTLSISDVFFSTDVDSCLAASISLLLSAVIEQPLIIIIIKLIATNNFFISMNLPP